MSGLLPLVRCMLLCEEVVIDPARANRYTLVGVLHTIRPILTPGYPFRHPRMDVFAQLTSCHGPVQVWLEVVRADNGQVAIRSPTWRFPFRNDPLAVRSIVLRLNRVRYTAPGLYWVRLWYNNTLLAEQALFAR